MPSAHGQQRRDLTFRTDFFADSAAFAAYEAFIARVFEPPPPCGAMAHDPAWKPFAYFDPAGRCVASLETAVLRLRLDGEDGSATAIRLAGVDTDWRGQGLFRDLMVLALARCESEATGPILLYTEDPDLYARFGFRPVPQHAFVGRAPRPIPGRLARVIDIRTSSDLALVERLLATRTPISDQCAILRAPSLFMDNVSEDLVMAYAADLDALVAFELEDVGITVVDILAASIPSMARLLGALPAGGGAVKVLFPTDRLAWTGAPTPDDPGLMARGALPPAMRRPFMLPPTTAF